jgi:hypothetical protein
MQTKARQGYALGALEFHDIPLPAKTDSPYPLATAFTKGDLLRYRGAAGRFKAHQIFRDFEFILCVQQAALMEIKLHGLNNQLQELRDVLVTWIGYFMKECPLIFPADKGAIRYQEMKV